MTTPQQFLESFLQEKTAAWAEARPRLTGVYAKFFGEPLSQHAERFMPRAAVRGVIEDVKQSDGIASAVAREHWGSADLRTRYRLRIVGESWKIVGIDRECFLCRGTGRSGGSKCQKCNGEGWCEPDRETV
jgi:hypothetical protein